MEKPYKISAQQTKEWIQEAGLEKPDAGFDIKIMEKIEATSILQKTTPLIGKKGWLVLSFIFVLSSLLMYLYPSEMFSFKGEIVFANLNTLKTVSISATTQYAFLFLVLFLVQIPFLKQYLDKQRA